MSKAKWGLLALLAMANATCGEAPFVAAPGATLTVIANPPFIVANGGVSVISALIIDPNGTPAANGTVVQFFTTLGSIEAQGQTRDGVARVNLVADARSGTATVTAVSGAATGPEGGVQVIIGSANPVLVIVTADPARVKRGGHSRITANVFDKDGNPIANVPVVFTLSGGTGRETLDSGGAQVFTDNNGQAFDTLRTSSSGGDAVTVTANTANGVSDDVVVGVFGPPPPSCILPTAVTGAASAVGTTSATLNGTVNANGTNTAVTFQYGTTVSYGTVVPANPSSATGSTFTLVDVPIALLATNTLYHFRVVAQSACGLTLGADMTFRTN